MKQPDHTQLLIFKTIFKYTKKYIYPSIFFFAMTVTQLVIEKHGAAVKSRGFSLSSFTS